MVCRSILFLLSCLIALHTLAQPATDIRSVQLASHYHRDIAITDYFVSEKLDGIRARWTGQQLLTRNGHPINAPSWFTQNWPNTPMEGELWTKRNDFETITSIVMRDTPDIRWKTVAMMLFDLPDLKAPFARRTEQMQLIVARTDSPYLKMIEQQTITSIDALEALLDTLIAQGAEGLMLHHKQALYENGRSQWLLKVKKYQDAEAKVIAHLPGKGKFKDKLGSLLVETREGLQFKIGSGFTDDERLNPPPIGSWITYKYYGVTSNRVPRFASYLRQRPAQDL